MEIGKQLKSARAAAGYTQESVAENINVSRQTVSNWENEKTYPDIISIVKLSNMYSISLDTLLKGDEKMLEHLEVNTNVVKSNRKLIAAIIINIAVVIAFVLIAMFQTGNCIFLTAAFTVAVICSSFLLFQIIKKF